MKHSHVLLRTILLSAAALFSVSANAAESVPDKPVRIIVPWAAGTGTDINARTVAQQITEATGQPAIVENRPGANGIIGSSTVLQEPADGLTLLATSNAHVANPFIMKNVPYDGLHDFTPVGGTRKLPALLVASPGLGVKTLADLTKLAKEKPGQISYGSGTTSALVSMELYQQMAGIKLNQVPYKSATLALNDLIGGHIDVMLIDVVNSIAHIRDGKIVPLAATAKDRLRVLPDLPTIAESGYPDYEIVLWTGMWVRAGTSPERVAFFNRMINLAAAAERESVESTGAEVFITTPDEFKRFVNADVAFWKHATQVANIHPQ